MKALFIAVLLCMAFCSAMADTTNYQSPADGKTYRADWHTYTPTNAVTTNAPASRVQKQGVRLLSTQAAFGRSVDVSELAGYVQKMEREIDLALGSTNAAFDLLVKVTLTKDKRPNFQMASSEGVARDVLQKIYDSLNKMVDFRSRSDEVAYEIRFKITKAP